LWGRAAPHWGGLPAVRAYVGPLPDGARGIEFTTDVAPEAGQGGFEARWYAGAPGVSLRHIDGQDTVILPVTVTRIEPS
jgi:hypothetical protein